ncbi:chitinase [Allofrancisella inopinata]|nr:chitinase [Allofrancisella inopinata]
MKSIILRLLFSFFCLNFSLSIASNTSSKDKILETNRSKYANTINVKQNDNGIVNILAQAATTDPLLHKITDISGKTKIELAELYYNTLFFPSEEIFMKIRKKDPEKAWGNFIAQAVNKNGCVANGKGQGIYKGCDKYYSLDNLLKSFDNLKNITEENYQKAKSMNTAAVESTLKERDRVDNFAVTDSDLDNLRQIAAFFAHMTTETGGSDGSQSNISAAYAFSAVQEGNCGNGEECEQYKVTSQPSGGNFPQWKKYINENYYGRGGKQLTYWENYEYYSQALYGDFRLLENPGLLVEGDKQYSPGEYGLTTSLAYLLLRYHDNCQTLETRDKNNNPIVNANCGPYYPSVDFDKPSMIEAFGKENSIETFRSKQWITLSDEYGKPGFGLSINLINGGVECKANMTYQAMNRINFYIEYLVRFGADIKNVVISYSNGSENVFTKEDLINNMINNSEGASDVSEWFTKYTTSPLLEMQDGKDKLGIYSNLDKISHITIEYGNGYIEHLDCVGYRTIGE